MGNVKRIYVEKKAPFAVKAKELKEEISSYLGISSMRDVRVFIRYDVENISEETFERECVYFQSRRWMFCTGKTLRSLLTAMCSA